MSASSRHRAPRFDDQQIPVQAMGVRALTLMAIPILMVALSVTLPARANRAAHLVVAPL